MLTAAKEGTFSASSDPCVFFPLAASGVYPKTRVWGSSEKMLHCFSATAPLSVELRRGCENSSGKTTAGSALDSNGNTLTRVVGSNTTTYAWDFENRLSTVTLPGSGGTVSFTYDPFGRRIKRVTSAGTSIYAYDGDNLVEETNSSGAAVARYSQAQNIDEPLAMLRSGATSYYHADGLGSVTSLSSSSGAIANTYIYDSFGKLTASTGSLLNPFRYTARESDTETELYYYRARYYDPNAGRFLSEDPARFEGGIDFYAYAKNNAINFNDPYGWEPNGQVTCGGTTNCDKYKQLWRYDLYAICRMFPHDSKSNCIRSCLQQNFGAGSHGVGSYNDPPIFSGGLPGGDAANALGASLWAHHASHMLQEMWPLLILISDRTERKGKP